MESKKQSEWTKFVFAAGLAIFAMAIGRGCPRHPEERNTSHLQKLKLDWKAGRILERLSLPVLGRSQCVDIVYDERQAKFGFFATGEQIIRLDVHSYPNYELHDAGDGAVLVVIHKPYAFHLDACDQDEPVKRAAPSGDPPEISN